MRLYVLACMCSDSPHRISPRLSSMSEPPGLLSAVLKIKKFPFSFCFSSLVPVWTCPACITTSNVADLRVAAVFRFRACMRDTGAHLGLLDLTNTGYVDDGKRKEKSRTDSCWCCSAAEIGFSKLVYFVLEMWEGLGARRFEQEGRH